MGQIKHPAPHLRCIIMLTTYRVIQNKTGLPLTRMCWYLYVTLKYFRIKFSLFIQHRPCASVWTVD